MKSFPRQALAGLWLLYFAATCAAKLSFDEIDYADTNAEKHQVLFTKKVLVDGEEVRTGFKTVARSGAEDPRGSGAVLGRVLDMQGRPLEKIKKTSATHLRGGRKENAVDVSHSPDFVSIMTRGTKIFMLAHFETPNPGSTYLMEVLQDDEGELTLQGFKALDWSGLGGLWTPCAGSVTPWGTHLGSEEYSPDARQIDVEVMLQWDIWRLVSENQTPHYLERMMRYFNVYPDELTVEHLRAFSPYMYGYPWEVDVTEDGSYTNVKHMAMGRTSVELAYVMPDNKTVYITDDGLNRVFTMFVADKEQDLSCGKLYAAKAEQLDVKKGGTFAITWIPLGGSVCESTLLPKAKTLRFADIFSVQKPDKNAAAHSVCTNGHKSVNTDVGMECLKVRDGMEVYASRFETRRYAALMGATTEWHKWEGITYSSRRRKIYTALSEISNGMEDFRATGFPSKRYDIGGSNDVRIPYNPCGCVYTMEVDDKLWVTKMYALTCGYLILGDKENKCGLDGVANPDNVAIIEEHNGLLIGEDTKLHENDIIWYMDLHTGNMTRILSTPYGSETTGPYWHSNVNGWSYMMVVVQHPYGDSAKEKRYEDDATGIQGWIGYIGPFRASISDDSK